jgi:microsomal prostaglandin-E synthase 2
MDAGEFFCFVLVLKVERCSYGWLLRGEGCAPPSCTLLLACVNKQFLNRFIYYYLAAVDTFKPHCRATTSPQSATRLAAMMFRSMRAASRVFIPAGVTVNHFVRQSSCASSAKPDPVLPAVDILLFQYSICPFCHMIRANMDYLGLPYSVIEVNPLTQSELAFVDKPRKVPVVIMDGEVVKESDAIVLKLKDVIETKSGDKKILKSLFTGDSEKWMAWSKEQLAVKIYPNITRNFSESWQAFEYTSGIESWTWYERFGNRVLGPVAMFFANGKVKKKYNIIDERKELLGCVQEWKAALNGKNFLHGDVITAPDLFVFGVLRSIFGFETFNILMEDAVLKGWYDRVNVQVEQRKFKGK